MKGTQTALPGSPTVATDKVGYWLTPPEVMRPLQEEFQFDFDACPFPRRSGYNSLNEEWGSRTYCNPPFGGGTKKWAMKALTESRKGKLVVLIVPARRIDSFNDQLLDAGAEARLLRSVEWLNPRGERPKRPGRCPCVLYILRGKS